MFKNYIKQIPGYRSDKFSKKRMATIFYILFFIAGIAMPCSTLSDRILFLLQKLLLLVVVWILFFNFLEIRDRLPLFNKKKKSGIFLGVLCFLVITYVTYTALESLMSPQLILYKNNKADYNVGLDFDEEIQNIVGSDLSLNDEPKVLELKNRYDNLSDIQKQFVKLDFEIDNLEKELTSLKKEEDNRIANEIKKEERLAALKVQAEKNKIEKEAEQEAEKKILEEKERIENLPIQYKLLMAHGVTEEVAKKIFIVATKCRVPFWDEESSISIVDGPDDDYFFSYSANDGDYRITFTYNIVEGEVKTIIDQYFKTIYDENGINKNYVFHKDINYRELKDFTIGVINNFLKEPHTAKYPGNWFDSMQDWAVAKDGDIIQLSSYVDFQNSFGAMVRSQFFVQYKNDFEKYTPIYVVIDGVAVYDDR